MYVECHMTEIVTAHEVTSYNLQHAPSTRQENQVGAVEKEDEEKAWGNMKNNKHFRINVRTKRKR
jgi:hypothetical protein